MNSQITEYDLTEDDVAYELYMIRQVLEDLLHLTLGKQEGLKK